MPRPSAPAPAAPTLRVATMVVWVMARSLREPEVAPLEEGQSDEQGCDGQGDGKAEGEEGGFLDQEVAVEEPPPGRRHPDGSDGFGGGGEAVHQVATDRDSAGDR